MTLLSGSVKIGGIDYRIVPAAALECMEGEFLGRFHHSRQQIAVADYLPPAVAAQVLVHEILHGIWEQWGIGEDGVGEEAAVNRASLGLTAVMRDNPGLIVALLEALAPDDGSEAA